MVLLLALRQFGLVMPIAMTSHVAARDNIMPSVSKRQMKFMGADLARKRAGKKTRTGMSEKQLRDYAKKKK